MKTTLTASLAATALLATPSIAGGSYMTVQTWDPGCEHTMETNNFELAAGASVEIEIDLSGCTAEQLGGLLFYGYAPRNSGSDGLAKRHNVRLRVVEQARGSETVSDDGHVLTYLSGPTRCTLIAENVSARKPITVRLVARSGL